MGMQGTKQLERDTVVGAPAGAVYRLFMDNAELANWAPAVDAVTHEHGGDRVRRCVERLDPHPGPPAFHWGEVGGEAVAGEHLGEPERVVHDQKRGARGWHRRDAPLDHGSLFAVHGHRAGAGRAQSGLVATVLDHTFVPRPGDLVTGVCPDARPTTTKTGGGHG